MTVAEKLIANSAMTPQSTDPATRHALIRSAVAMTGSAPTINAMRSLLLRDGVKVSHTTLCRDYNTLGLRSPVTSGRKPTGATKVPVKYLGIPVALYDRCCVLANQRGVHVTVILRAMIAIGVRHTSTAA